MAGENYFSISMVWLAPNLWIRYRFTATVLHTIHGIVAHFCCPLWFAADLFWHGLRTLQIYIHQRHLCSVRLLLPHRRCLSNWKGLIYYSSAFLLGICISIVSVSVLLLSADWHCLLEEISHIWVPFTMMTGLFRIAFGCSGMAAPFAQKTLNHLWWWLSVFCPITGRIDKSLSIQSVCTIFCLAHRTQLPK